MRNERNEELERIKRRKIGEIMRRISGKTWKSKPASKFLWWPVDLADELFVTFVEENALVVVDFCVP